MTAFETKRKIEESIALLNSVLAQPAKKQSTRESRSSLLSSLSASSVASIAHTTDTNSSGPRKRSFLPPRPAVLDKLTRLSGSSNTRPTLSDSIAASIAASESSRPHAIHAGHTGSSTESTVAKTFQAKWRYMPWSREQFDERLETFKPSTWFDKPKLVNAVECAKRGWINTAEDRLECCGGCGGIVIVKIDQDLELEQATGTKAVDQGQVIDDDFASEFDMEALGPQFREMLTNNHAMSCPWKAHPCDDSIYKFPVVSQSRACQELLERVKQLETIADSPLIAKIRHPLTAEQIEHIQSLVPEVKNPTLLVLALFGWTVSDKTHLLSCPACHTQCSHNTSSGSTSYLYDDDDSYALLLEEDDSGLKDAGAFDVIQSHKWYCYWVDAEFNLPKKEAGWKSLVQLLMPKVQKNSLTSSGSTSGPAEDTNEPRRIIEPLEAVAQIKRMLRGQATLSSSSLMQ
ncbi:hypothetical protein BGZ94_000168 [Podila epigama]|nr:hypothetical protein BGZ94_000168 [Podila epigama]